MITNKLFSLKYSYFFMVIDVSNFPHPDLFKAPLQHMDDQNG